MKPISLVITFLLSMLCFEISLASSGLNFQPLASLSSSQIEHRGTKGRVGLFDNYSYSLGPKRAFSFSQNSQLFALFQLYDEELASIRVWDTRTGELKYRTIISDFFDASGGGYLSLDFSNDDKALIVTGMIAGPYFTWEFTKNENTLKSCKGYMGGSAQEINEPYFTTLTADSEYSLCQFGVEGELVNYKSWMPEDWWGRNTQTLHNGKILTIYNYRLASEAQHQFKEKPPAGIMEWVDLWDLNYISTANRLISQLDRKNNEFFLIDVFNKKTIINQWDYANKKQLSQTAFDGMQVEKVYLTDHYLLLRNKNMFSLVRRTDTELKLMWSKNLSAIYEGLAQIFPPGSLYRDDHEHFDPYSITFSSDEKHIIFRNTAYQSSGKDKLFSPVVLVDVASGATQKYPPIMLDTSVIVDPQARYFFKDEYGCDTEKTKLYSLTEYSDSKEIEGEVMAISSDGNVLVTCHKKELLFFINN
ncbi:hypothetical protein [Candidatus Thiothrix anitrata]|uniref:Uncharacterized protein n=1 Tax=Candidatus Thiothrix anitrata TaxID=2823902 RepID=A0ABX7X363_9GAMM|nr:hypothetical protein [Candidatus Thiothrix anitrata]QTR49842.1 hypothetical protein J8380_16720 [Candidatus Thiothrix anitrata]